MKDHKAGFVSIVGKPNVGKSTLMNVLVGEKLSIITSKAQTTRHRIMGIISDEDFQIVYSDTPGILDPQYALHQSMMAFVHGALEDADLILFINDLYEDIPPDDPILKKINQSGIPVLFVLNKIDQAKGTQAHDKIINWKEKLQAVDYIPISALEKLGTTELMQKIIDLLPNHPPYFPKDELTDKPLRFFAAEIIREKIFLNYRKEVPYSAEVLITEFKNEPDIIRIRAEIFVERKSQKGILIGHKGAALKKVGTEARHDLESFFDKKVFLETYVKVADDWRRQQTKLKQFGYRS